MLNMILLDWYADGVMFVRTQRCMKDGEIVESGTHRTLIERKGEYERLYQIQAQAFVET